MISRKQIAFFVLLVSVFIMPDVSFGVTDSKVQSAIQTGTNVRSRVTTTGLFTQECHDAYYGCMDEFCIVDNSDGGSCACSNLNDALEARLIAIRDKVAEAERIRTEEVERVKAGAKVDIIFNGRRKYDKDGNIVYSDAKSDDDILSLWNKPLTDSDDDDSESNDNNGIANQTGDELFKTSDALCRAQMPSSCVKEVDFLNQLYARQILADCKAFENNVADKEAKANTELANANADVRSAIRDSFTESNKYDLNQCIIEFKKCMKTNDACGADWENCVSVIAYDKMQNISVVTKDDEIISESTLNALNTKRPLCENVLAQCVAVQNRVWPSFLSEVATELRFAEARAESRARQSCLTDITDCIHNACRDDIAGRGVATMDACLSRPDMARSFCKVELDPCEKMEPSIWEYISDKLAAMRVDACTTEVKDCFTDSTRCGADFANCIGMDYDFIHNLCPLDKLVACKTGKPGFSMSDLDSMLMGLYLNVDNAMLDNCKKVVETRLLDVCGSTTDCNRFASGENMGSGSLRLTKDGNKYRITGMISFGAVNIGGVDGQTKDGENLLAPGQIGVQDYLTHVESQNTSVPDASAIFASVEDELKSVANTINRTIDLIEQDQEIQYCINGRDLKQITGRDEKTTARFPNLLNQTKMMVASSALLRAQNNHNERFYSMVADATKNASVDVAQRMCQMMPWVGATNEVDGITFTAPYAISYEIENGLNTNVAKRKAVKRERTNDNDFQFGKRAVQELPFMVRETWSSFDRESRVCHLCTATVSKNCNESYQGGFLGIGAKKETSCTKSDPVEKCEDIEM